KNKGQVLYLLKQYEDALVAYQHAAEFAPLDANLSNVKGLILQELGRHEEALAAFDQAISLDPSSAHFYKEKAITLQKLRRIDEAREARKKARQLGGASPLVEMVVDKVIVEKQGSLSIIILKEMKRGHSLSMQVASSDAILITTNKSPQAR